MFFRKMAGVYCENYTGEKAEMINVTVVGT
jgi:hypothetical protein